MAEKRHGKGMLEERELCSMPLFRNDTEYYAQGREPHYFASVSADSSYFGPSLYCTAVEFQ